MPTLNDDKKLCINYIIFLFLSIIFFICLGVYGYNFLYYLALFVCIGITIYLICCKSIPLENEEITTSLDNEEIITSLDNEEITITLEKEKEKEIDKEIELVVI